MKTRQVNTDHMRANHDVNGHIFSLLEDVYGMSVVCNHNVDYSDALYSDGFVNAILKGLIPVLGTEEPSYIAKKKGEYHHFISDGECYVVYFTEKI